MKKNSLVKRAATIVLLRHLGRRIAEKESRREEIRRENRHSGISARIKNRIGDSIPGPEKTAFLAMGGSAEAVAAAGARLAAKKAKELQRTAAASDGHAGAGEKSVRKSAGKKRSHMIGRLLVMAAVHELTKKPARRKRGLLHL